MPASTAKPHPDPAAPREPRIFPLWYWVVGAFVALILAWGSLIVIAGKNKVEVIEIEPAEAPTETETAAQADPDE